MSASCSSTPTTAPPPCAATTSAAISAPALQCEEEQIGPLYDSLQREWTQLESLAPSALQERAEYLLKKFISVEQRARTLRLFPSKNETKDDISSGDLRFIFTPFYIGDLYLRLQDRDTRMRNLSAAQVFLESFLELLQRLEMLSPEDERAFRMPPTDAAGKRGMKVARFQRQRKITEELAILLRQRAALGGDSDRCEDVDRALLVLQGEQFATMALDQLPYIAEEQGILRYAEEQKRNPTPQEPYVPTPLSITHIPAVSDRQRIFSEVFGSRFEPPTYSVEEWGEIELKWAQEAQRKRDENPQGPEPELDDSDEERHEQARRKARDWENWKDDHPPHGNTKRI